MASTILPSEQFQSEKRDRLSAATSQLSSLLQVLHGQGFESFNRSSEAVKDNVLWLAADLAAEIESLLEPALLEQTEHPGVQVAWAG